MKKYTPPSNLALLVTVDERDRSSQWFHMLAEPVRFANNGEGVKSLGRHDCAEVPREVEGRTYTEYVALGGTELRGLRISMQNDSERAAKGETSYGWRVTFHCDHLPSNLDLDEARRMVKVLSAFEKKFEALNADLGQPASFSEYVLRAAKALGITTFVTYRDEPRNGYRTAQSMNGGEVRSYIDRKEREYIARFAPPKAED